MENTDALVSQALEAVQSTADVNTTEQLRVSISARRAS